FPLVGLESILLVDPDPRQLLPPPRQLVAAPRQLFLRLEQLEPGGEPLFTCPDHVFRHRCSLLPPSRRVPPGASARQVRVGRTSFARLAQPKLTRRCRLRTACPAEAHSSLPASHGLPGRSSLFVAG